LRNGLVFFTSTSGNIPPGFKKNANKQQTPQGNKRGGAGGGFGEVEALAAEQVQTADEADKLLA